MYQVVQLLLAGLREKGSFSFIVIQKSKEWKKIVNVSFSKLATYWRKSEEFRIQSSLHLENKLKRQLMVLESDVHKGVLLKHNFSLYNHLHFYQR